MEEEEENPYLEAPEVSSNENVELKNPSEKVE